MSFTNIFMRAGKSEAYRAAVLESVSLSLTLTLGIAERRLTLTEQDDQCFSFWQSYLGVERADDLVIIQITHDCGRAHDRKAVLFRRILNELSTRSGIDPQNVFISLVQVAEEEWPFVNGAAQQV